jgi:hypothetical protein
MIILENTLKYSMKMNESFRYKNMKHILNKVHLLTHKGKGDKSEA